MSEPINDDAPAISLPRAMWKVLEPCHAMIYFAAEARAAYSEAGLKGYWMGYFASRSAAMGPVGPEVVAATFYNFHPRMVARAIPDAWRFDARRSLDDVVLDNVFTGFGGVATIDDNRATRRLEADRALRFAVVYVPEDGDAFAVEPVTHETDAFNRAAAGARATGMRVLGPGDAFSCTMRIAARALPGITR